MRRTRLVAFRTLAIALFAAAGLVWTLQVPSGAVAPVETGYWTRPLPTQSDEIEGQASPGPAVMADLSPQVDVPEPTIPVTTLPPTPVPIPTVPQPPITTPPPPANPPPPAPVPDGGLYVANTNAGATGVSALRFADTDVGDAVLRLVFAQGTIDAGPMVACPALAGWIPQQNGSWSTRPPDDCERLAIEGNLTPDGALVEFSLPNGFLPIGATTYDVIIRPLSTSGDPFQAVFEAPDAQALEVLSPAEPIQAPPDTVFDPGFDLPGDDIIDPNLAPGGFGFGTDSFTEDLAPGTPIDDDGGVVEPPPAVIGGAANPIEAVADVLDNPAARIMSVLALAMMGAWFFWASNQPVRAPRLLGGLAGSRPEPATIDPFSRPRGIGRFARPRAEPPQKLV